MENKWISVNDRPPEYNENVLVFVRNYKGFNSFQKVSLYEKENPWIPEITHWMPLPEDPQEELPCNFCGTPNENNPHLKCARTPICTNDSIVQKSNCNGNAIVDVLLYCSKCRPEYFENES